MKRVDMIRTIFMQACREVKCDCPLPLINEGWRQGCSLERACYSWEAKEILKKLRRKA